MLDPDATDQNNAELADLRLWNEYVIKNKNFKDSLQSLQDSIEEPAMREQRLK